ncbi:hypothetical protein EG833_01555, partial [archaeon]|nr:hypothetical protein [archaeon]
VRKKEEEKESRLPALLASFGISELAIKNGTFLYEDRKVSRDPKNPPAPEESPARVKKITVSRMDAEMRDISFTNAMAINVKGSLLGEPSDNFDISGSVGPIGLVPKKSDMPLALTVRMDSISMKRLTEDLGLGYRAASGTLNGEISISGTLKQKLATSVKITLKDLVKQRKQGDAGQVKPVPCTLDFNGKILYEAPGQNVTMEPSVLKANGSSFSLAGKVQHMNNSPALNFILKSTMMETGSLSGIAPVLGASLPADLTLKGQGSLEASCVGVSQDMALETRINLTPSEISLGSKFNKPAGQNCTFTSSANLKEGFFTISSLDLILYNLQLAGSGSVRLKGEAPAMDVRFATKPFALKGWDAFIPLLNAYKLGGSLAIKADITGTPKAPVIQCSISSQEIGFTLPADKKKAKSKETPSVLQGLDLSVHGKKQEKEFSAEGSLGVQSGKIGQIGLSKLTSRYTYSMNQFNVPSFQLGIFNGNVNGAVSYQTKLKDWSFSSQMKKIDAGQAMNTLTSFKDIFAGSLSGKILVRGNTAKKGLDSLASEGAFTIDKGKINNLDIVKSTIDGLSGIKGLSGIVSTEQGAVKRNIETKFDSLNLDFKLLGKVMEVPSMKLVNIYTGKETNTISSLKGSIDMVSRKIDFDGDVAFSPDYSSR